MKICIFCSANNISQEYFRMTEELVRWAAAEGHGIVFGGANDGLMDCVCKVAREAGAHTTGIAPKIIIERGRANEHVDELVICDNVSDRKELMMARSDVFIILPGGIGTLDELFTVASAATLGYHSKPIVIYNMCGFWNSLIALLDNLQSKGVMRGDWHDSFLVAESIEDIARICSRKQPQ